MPYQRLSGQVVKAKLRDRYLYDSFGYKVRVCERYAELTVRIGNEKFLKLECPPEESGAWMGKRVNVVITTKEDQ